LVSLAAWGSLASAELISVGDQIAVRNAAVAVPSRGARMRDVEARFGEPAARHAAVGQPPITRWDYEQFSVYFEFDRVIHSVAR
jgi:hypothetical protein